MEALLKYASTSMTNPGKVAVEVLRRKLDLVTRLPSDAVVGQGFIVGQDFIVGQGFVVEQGLWGTAASPVLHKMSGKSKAGLHNPGEIA